MKKRIVSLILAFAVLCTFVPCFAATEQYVDLYYTVNDDNTITITSCDKTAISVNIPSEINGLSVTTIGETAFAECSSLSGVTIPDSVTTIGYAAFAECRSLTSVTISGNITTIERMVFRACHSLTSITIPDSVTTIGEKAFEACTSLKNVTIPDSVTTIGNQAFYVCNGLTNVTIGNGVKTIGQQAFCACNDLTNVTIGNSVTRIGESAFSSCSGLTSVTIPDSVTRIDNYAFRDCSRLTDVYYGGSEAEWKEIFVGSYNSYLLDANIHYNTSDETTEPTTAPTTAPTTEPTSEPTAKPTSAPTAEPTTKPTTESTTEPTSKPTTAPTTEPTTEPTTAPTTEPTAEPTSAPTAEPTTAPTTVPTTVPTAKPTKTTAPIAKPTSTPTVEPTSTPTTEPTTTLKPTESEYKFSLSYNNGTVAITSDGAELPEGSVLIAAQYNKGQMTKVKIYDADKNVDVSKDFDTYGTAMKLMLWNSIEEMKPLAEAIESAENEASPFDEMDSSGSGPMSMVVSDVKEGQDPDGNVIYEISGYSGGADVKFTTNQNTVAGNLTENIWSVANNGKNYNADVTWKAADSESSIENAVGAGDIILYTQYGKLIARYANPQNVYAIANSGEGTLPNTIGSRPNKSPSRCRYYFNKVVSADLNDMAVVKIEDCDHDIVFDPSTPINVVTISSSGVTVQKEVETITEIQNGDYLWVSLIDKGQTIGDMFIYRIVD